MVGGNNQLMIGARTDLHSVPSWRKAKLAQNMRLQPPYTKQSAHTQNIPRRRVNENNADNITAAQDFSNQNRADAFNFRRDQNNPGRLKTVWICAKTTPHFGLFDELYPQGPLSSLSSMMYSFIRGIRLSCCR